VAEPTRRSGLGRGLDALIPTGPRETGDLLPPYEDPVAGRIDDLVDEVRRLGERVDDLVRATADSARRRLWHRRCGTGIARAVGTARTTAGRLVGIGTALALDVGDLALGTTRELLDIALSAVRGMPAEETAEETAGETPADGAPPENPPPAATPLR
jgi:hypothetical protein